jgi:tRNA (cmo5U34)-methyltransferase
MPEDTVREAFERLSADYDRRFPLIIPHYREFHQVVIRRVLEHVRLRGRSGTWIELGCGTGELSRRLLEAVPDLSLHALDLSPAMVARAREKLAAWAGRVTIEVGNVLTAPLPADAGGAVSALAVHHLEAEEKRALFGRVLRTLAPGGLFVLADAVAGDDARAEASYEAVWVEHMTGAGLPQEEVEAVLDDHRRNDRFSRLDEQLAWLREAGFTRVECLWKHDLLAVVAAERPEGRPPRP